MVPDPDAELVRILQEGDEHDRRRALGTLFDRHHRRVLNVSFRVLNDRQMAQDVVQEVFMKLPRTIRGFRGDASFTSWIYRIAVNRSIDRRRREARRPAARLGDIPPDVQEDTPGGRTAPALPESGVTQEERADRVQAALMSLSPKLRAVAVLRYVEGLSYEQLAEALDCSMGTIKSRLNRAHTALARALGDLGTPPERGGSA